jgi:PIN domain nuclease of toxin-antitoxin system
MKLLLDTHAFLWFIDGNVQLSLQARSLIEDETNRVYLSMARLWEMGIKVSTGKLSFARPMEKFIPQLLVSNDIRIINVDLRHVGIITTLPFHHRDPFDRLLVAQAMVENMPIVSVDSAFDDYPITRMW